MINLKKFNVEYWRAKFNYLKNLCLNLKSLAPLYWQNFKTLQYKDYLIKAKTSLKKIKIKKIKPLKLYKKFYKVISDSWKAVLIIVPSFLFCYYFIGSMISEKIDITSAYSLPKEPSEKFETANSMAFLIKREIDNHTWTPNLPLIFPAVVLDNMPNFQVGILEAVRDTSGAMKKFEGISEAQVKDVKKAYDYLKYSPYVWLLSKKSSFSIAPSSNSQYRKGRKELINFYNDGNLQKSETNFDIVLKKVAKALRKRMLENDSFVHEHASEWFNFSDDDLFYKNKGYAFAQWQIMEALGLDFKEVILQKDAYTEWTYLLGSLRKAAELNPLIIRNAKVDSAFFPNHLTIQNYYIARALSALESIRNTLLREEKDANKN